MLAKFTFDLYILSVDIAVPQALQLAVQWVKAPSAVTTQKKVVIAPGTKSAVFKEKLSLVTSLVKEQSSVDYNSLKYKAKPVHLKLLAYYNGKEKAIGVATFDLASFANTPAGQMSDKQTLTFTKCFDAQARVNFTIKAK